MGYVRGIPFRRPDRTAMGFASQPNHPPIAHPDFEFSCVWNGGKPCESTRSAGWPVAPATHFLVGVERFLRGPEIFRHVLQVDPNSRPGVKPPAHRIDEHVGRLKMCRGLGMSCAPALEAGERVVLLLRTPDLNE